MRFGSSFRETMDGVLRRDGSEKPFSFSFDVTIPKLFWLFETVTADAVGRVRIEGLASDAPAAGGLEISVFRKRRIRYTFDFSGDDGRAYQFDGWKTITPRFYSSWTTLPGIVTDRSGKTYGEALLRFSFRRHFPGLLKSVRLVRLSAPTSTRRGGRLKLGARSRGRALALAKVMMPSGRRFGPPDDFTTDRLEATLAGIGAGAIAGYRILLGLMDLLSRARYRRSLDSMTETQLASFLSRLNEGGVARRALAYAVTTPLKVARYDDPEIYRAFDAPYHFDPQPRETIPEGVTKGEDLERDLALECDVVVVGTGAGGAVVAKELTDLGLSVVMVEEGDYFTQDAFRGSTSEAFANFYRNHGATGSVGNVIIPIPMGRLVGGTTAINTGTCWRTPDWVLKRWAGEGLTNLEASRMDPYFERVEQALSVAAPSSDLLGGVARVIARGSDALGYSHRPLLRNAPGCKGSGVCNFGCPTGSKQATNLSYVPNALLGGARLFTGARVDRIVLEGEAARGVEATVGRTRRRVRVRSRAVVLACGTLLTPALLQQQGIGKRLPMLGKNLSIHPATGVSAVFDEEIRGFAAAPQGYCVDELHRQGILAMGASAPISLGSGQFSFLGPKLTEVMEAYDRLATFGVMVEDRSRGRVRATRRGGFRAFYWLGAHERDLLVRGMQMVSRIYLEAGAKEVYPLTRKPRIIKNKADVDALGEHPPSASDLLLSAYHPLGTCRMATSAERGVVSSRFEVFGVPGLYIADGSVVPGSPAVNPQVTIMTLATMAAESIADDLADRQ